MKYRLSGWWRVWIVLTAVFLACATALAITAGGGPTRSGYEQDLRAQCPGDMRTMPQAQLEQMRNPARPWPPFEECVSLRAMPYAAWQMHHLGWLASVILRPTLIWALLLLAIGFATRWLIAGFRTTPSQPTAR